MPRALGIPEWLAAFGVHVVLEPGWDTRGNGDFDPKGVVCHHTAVKGSAVKVCINGRPDLPGPLCNIVLARDGVAHVIAAGRANHAGRGGWRGLSGNRSVFGIEADNDGREPWPAVQAAAFQLVTAALLHGVGSPAEMACGHKEWAPGRKVDPHTIDMNAFRAGVALDLHHATHDPKELTLDATDRKYLDTQFAALHKRIDDQDEVLAGRNPGDPKKRSLIGRIGDAVKAKP